MEDSRFDALVRRLGDAGSRRPLLGAGLGALAVLGTSAHWSLDAEARKKHKKGKKKHKKGGGTTTSTTTQAPPACPDGQKLCQGSCIDATTCCDDSDCAADQTCLGPGGICACTDSNTISCGQNCCDKTSQVCRFGGDGTACVAGTCPSATYCGAKSNDPLFVCANSPAGACFCTNTVDTVPQPTCVSFDVFNTCIRTAPPCGNSSQCPSGSVCIKGGLNCEDCPAAFCAPRCTA